MRLRNKFGLALIALPLLASCGGSGGSNREVQSASAAVNRPATNGPEADYPVVIGSTFEIDGVTYTPVDRMNYDGVGYAQVGSEGGGGISGAHKTLPLPSYVEVTSLDSGKTILVRIERRGPMDNNHVIELSPGAADQLGVPGQAHAPIRVRRVNPPETERALLRSGQRAADRMDTPKPLLAVLARKLPALPGMPEKVSAIPQEPVLPAKSSELPPVFSPSATAPTSKAPTPAVTKPSTPIIPVKSAPQPTAADKGSIVVQVAAFGNKANADRLAASLGGHSEDAGKLWRVRLGPYKNQADAAGALAKVRSQGYKDARILTLR